MLETNEMAYYAMRAEQERNRAAVSRSDSVRAVHQLLADRYQAIVDSGKPPEPRRGGCLTDRYRR